ncbi:MAG: radical SAM protein [Nitrospirae bacterium]|nr:radical SAM protein [Nitrospirota bacterium]
MAHSTPEFPKRLEIELSSNCNLKCVYCPRHHMQELSGYINWDLFVKIIDEASLYPETIIVLHRRGESMMHPRFKELLRYVAGKFGEIQMATNATLLVEDKFASIVDSITFLSFSLDVPSVYEKTRVPAKYGMVEKNILKFLDFNQGRVKTQTSMVRSDYTTDEDIETFKRLWQSKVDRVRVYDEHSKDGRFGSLDTPRAERKLCVMPFYEMLVYDDGGVGRCNHDWNGDPMGNVNNQTLYGIWHSENYRGLRGQHERLEFTDAVCRSCDSWYPEIGNQGTGEVLER